MRDHTVWGRGPDGMNTPRNLGERFRVRDLIAGPGGAAKASEARSQASDQKTWDPKA